jgi:ADP-heptose:LPS heptosyltransferase
VILALRALGIGDLATVVPALRGLRAAFPGQMLALAAPRWLAPLVGLIGGIDRLVPVDGLGPHDWPVTDPAWAVNLHGSGPQSHRLLRAARPRRLAAFACPDAGHSDGPAWRADEHEVRRWCRLLLWYGIDADPDDLLLHRPSPGQMPAGVSIVHPGAKAAGRRWPPNRFAEVARGLTARGHRVVVTGTEGERRLAEQVAARAGLPGTAVLAGRTDVGHLAALVAHARLLVSGDTGIGHLATGYGIPSVLLFGPVAPAQWGPPDDRPWHRALWTGPVRPTASLAVPPDGVPEPPHPALAALGVGQVLTAADEVERAGRTRGAAVDIAAAGTG